MSGIIHCSPSRTVLNSLKLSLTFLNMQKLLAGLLLVLALFAFSGCSKGGEEATTEETTTTETTAEDAAEDKEE